MASAAPISRMPGGACSPAEREHEPPSTSRWRSVRPVIGSPATRRWRSRAHPASVQIRSIAVTGSCTAVLPYVSRKGWPTSCRPAGVPRLRSVRRGPALLAGERAEQHRVAHAAAAAAGGDGPFPHLHELPFLVCATRGPRRPRGATSRRRSRRSPGPSCRLVENVVRDRRGPPSRGPLSASLAMATASSQKTQFVATSSVDTPATRRTS